jgi:hypothetical protein
MNCPYDEIRGFKSFLRKSYYDLFCIQSIQSIHSRTQILGCHGKYRSTDLWTQLWQIFLNYESGDYIMSLENRRQFKDEMQRLEIFA